MLQHAGAAHQREFFARDMDRPEIRPFLHVYPTSQLNGWAYLTDGICPSILRGGSVDEKKIVEVYEEQDIAQPRTRRDVQDNQGQLPQGECGELCP